MSVLHVDGDSFFVSCEVARDPRLRGKPVVTGRERGIASAMSYEAKRRGISRGMPVWEMKKICPDVIVIPSDYETYSLYSKRMQEIVHRYAGVVEEYSIDECFADLSGDGKTFKERERVARKIKDTLQSELGMTFSIGLGSTKVITKIGSNWNKPDGFTAIADRDIKHYLKSLATHDLWGIGARTSSKLSRRGIFSALDFYNASWDWIHSRVYRPYQDIWRELHGEQVYRVDDGPRASYQSISKTKTFTPPTCNKEFVLSQLSKNIENACIKARRYGLGSSRISFFIKTQQFKYRARQLDLLTPTNSPVDILEAVREHLADVWHDDTLYRSSGVRLLNLEPLSARQLKLFGRSDQLIRKGILHDVTDTLAQRFGKHTVFLGSSLGAKKYGQHAGERGYLAHRAAHLFPGETTRRRLGIPLLGVVT